MDENGSGSDTRARTTFGRRIRLTVAAIVLMVVVALSVFSAEIYQQLRSLQATSRDNVQWSMAQLEVEYLIFQDIVHEADEGEATLAAVRRRFDIFYSRVDILANSDVFAVLTADPENARSLSAIRSWLEETVPLIDGPDDALGAALPNLDDAVQALREPIRRISLQGVRLFAEASDKSRDAFSALLFQTAAIAGVLIVSLGVLLGLFIRQNRISMRRAEQLRLSAERFEQTINGSLNAIVVTDEAGTVVGFNPGAERTFGYSRNAALGTSISALIVPQRHRAAHAAGMERYRTTGKGNIIGKGRVEIEARHADGHEFMVELALASTSGPEGKRFVAYLRDITERLQNEQDLTEARDKALAAARSRSQFLAVMSHEMRTPLNGVLAVLDLLGETRLDGKQREFVETAIASGEILQHHIDDVLDITRIESGQLTLQPKPFDLAALLEEIARINRPSAEARVNTISVKADLPDGFVLADRHRITQLLLNLVGNAVKFTEGGRIEIRAGRAGGEAPGVFDIAVSDSGIGIDAGDMERIFDDFVTLDPSYRRKAAGSGLGLSICRRIARAMGGEILVESQIARGSRFTLRLPLEFVAAEAPSAPLLLHDPDAAPIRTEALKVLLVEDNETNRFAAREMLRREGCEVTEAKDGLIGLSLSERQCYDLILMDISMPRLDGMEATRAIRKGDGASAASLIIGLTAHALPEEQRKLREAGMQACLTKPLRVRALRETLEEYFPAAAQQPPDPEPTPPPEPEEGEDPVLEPEIISELQGALTPAKLTKFIAKYRSELLAVAAELHAAGEDLAVIRALAHRAAGAASLIGAEGLKAIFATLEDVAIDNEAEFIAPLLEELDKTIPVVFAALDRLDTAPPDETAPTG
ncbi:ATP-binding protein [Acuticoccus sp. MNP-M23]|uniref:hybrid sensor histidine kinase/response regulator n=1 Tax=Acuticoccus sp. MNP-M23 TaxID=3072793 RepID=UPI0028152440|nr:ATP-binding protein [Acuticoccus sp. MNP-M23]WMS42795.1 ATP-binding protein [Acuticoccus sp. MNP-M23]